MSEQFLGEVRIMSFAYAPQNWALCNGQILPIGQYQALFALLGTMYGGDGVTTFKLPDLRGRIPVGAGQGVAQGTQLGVETVSLQSQHVPSHYHLLLADAVAPTASNVDDPTGAALGQSGGVSNPGGAFTLQIYGTSGVSDTLAPQTVAPVGGQPHENRQPYLALNYCIAMYGIFPSRG